MSDKLLCCVCGEDEELRYGVCFICAEAQSIIVDGVDMYDKGLDAKLPLRGFSNDKGTRAETSLDKIKLLIQRGWQKPSDDFRDKAYNKE